MSVSLASKDSCTGCGVCIASCNKSAIERILGNDGHFYIKVNNSKCISCGSCVSHCPVLSIPDSYNNDLSLTESYMAWSLDSEIRKRGTSGGVFGAIAKDFIRRGGIVFGAYLSNNKCKHVIVENIDDIKKIQGSKYLYSDISDCYATINNYLKNNKKVLFSGLPCQIAGVKSFFKKSAYIENLYTIDLVCGGIPSMLLLETFLKEHPSAEIISFRNKSEYTLTYNDNGITKSIGRRNLLINGYLTGLTCRYSCTNCVFGSAHRDSDITLGDYWQPKGSRESFVPEGISLLLKHSDHANYLIDSGSIYLSQQNWGDFLKYNPRIVSSGGTINYNSRIERVYIGSIFKRLPVYFIKAYYASNFKKYDIVSLLFVLYRKIRFKMIQHSRLIHVKSVLLKNKI